MMQRYATQDQLVRTLSLKPIDSVVLPPLAATTVGLESFSENLLKMHLRFV